jgi:hypothetical protein
MLLASGETWEEEMNTYLNVPVVTGHQSRGTAHEAEARRSRSERAIAALRRARGHVFASQTNLSWATRTGQSGSGRRGWQVKARDLHPGDVVQQHDWPLHVRQVTLSEATVAIAVTEFEFPLRYAADEPVQLAA